MKKKFKMFRYRMYDKYVKIKDFIIKKFHAIKEHPQSKLIIAASALTTVLVIGLIIFICTRAASNTSPETTSVMEAAVTVTDETSSEVIVETTTEVETTTPEPTTEAQTVDLIDISQIQVSDTDLSEEPVRQNNYNTNDEPEYIEPSPSDTFCPTDYSSVIYGIDVSKWQGKIDWQQVYNAGYRFVFVKVAGRGTITGELYFDDRYKENLKGAADAGLNVGVYIFSQAITEREALEEASLVINAIRGYNITYPVVFDWETGVTSSGRKYRSNAAALTNAEMTKIVNTFINAVESAGYEAMVYGNSYDLSLFDITSVSARTKVWYARYWSYYRYNDNYFTPGKQVPETNFPYEIWQYKDTGVVPGISEKVDMNVQFISNTIKITPVENTIYVQKNSTANLLDYVTAKNSKLRDVTEHVTYTIKDSQSKIVSQSQALSKVGEYTITYSASHMGENATPVNVKLVVHEPPTINLTHTNLVYFDKTDATITDSELAAELHSLIENNLVSAHDYRSTIITSSVITTYPDILYLADSTNSAPTDISDLSDCHLVPGNYEISYSVTDSLMISAVNKLQVSIVSLLSNEITIEYYNDNANDNSSNNSNSNSNNNASNNSSNNSSSNASNNLSDIISNIENSIRSNLSINSSQVYFEYDESFNNMISTGTISPGDYYITYYINGLDKEMYYRRCKLTLIEIERPTEDESETTSESPSETENESDTTSNSETS